MVCFDFREVQECLGREISFRKHKILELNNVWLVSKRPRIGYLMVLLASYDDLDLYVCLVWLSGDSRSVWHFLSKVRNLHFKTFESFGLMLQSLFLCYFSKFWAFEKVCATNINLLGWLDRVPKGSLKFQGCFGSFWSILQLLICYCAVVLRNHGANLMFTESISG